MTTIGAGWLKEDKNKSMYISVKLDDAILPLTITNDKMISIRPNKNKENNKQPDYYVDLFVPKKQTSDSEKPENPNSEEFPF